MLLLPDTIWPMLFPSIFGQLFLTFAVTANNIKGSSHVQLDKSFNFVHHGDYNTFRYEAHNTSFESLAISLSKLMALTRLLEPPVSTF